MNRRRLFLLAVVLGTGLALLFAQFEIVPLQEAFQASIGATAVQQPMQVPGVALALFAAFVVGASMIVTPCLLPVVFSFVPAARESGSRVAVLEHLVLYTLGMVAVSAAIGVIVGFLGGQVVGVLQSVTPLTKQIAAVIFSAMGALFLLWGLHAFHLISLPRTNLYYTGVNWIEDSAVGERSRSLLYGVAVGAALGISCPVPTYHAILLWTALVGDPVFGLVVLTALGVGRILPLWAMVVFPRQSVQRLVDTVGEHPERMHTYNGFAITILGSFLLVFWIGVMQLRLL